jgi:hypothetical protein
MLSGLVPMMPDLFERSQARKSRSRTVHDPTASAHIVDLDNNCVNTNIVARPRRDRRSAGKMAE